MNDHLRKTGPHLGSSSWRLRGWRLALPLLFVLAGCAAPAAPLPTQLIEASTTPTNDQPFPPPTKAPSTEASALPPSPPTEVQLPTEEQIIPPIDFPMEATPTPVALPRVEGKIVLRLTPGSGAGQVGIRGDSLNAVGPGAFRIGGDGTIRLLDNYNRRILFFDQEGKPLGSLSIAEAENPVDFIVNPQGSVFVFDRGDGITTQILRYTPAGTLAERLPLDSNVGGADGIMLTADQDLLIVSGNLTYWSLIHKGVVVAPELQPLTNRKGTATPRSPLIFRTIGDASGARTLSVESTTSPSSITSLALNLPNQVGYFFNIDRAMNLYFIGYLGYSEMAVARVLPDGTVAGGAQIQEEGCQLSWRQFYIDQAGAAWSLCVNYQAATMKRYTLQSPAGQPLPEASTEPADVIWRPGAQINLSNA
jgi:hypothetical protein